MKTTLKAIAAATVIALAGTSAFAQSPSMGQGFNMLQTALMNDFDRLGIPLTELELLTLGQIAVIKSIVESDDQDGQKKGRIQAIIANN